MSPSPQSSPWHNRSHHTAQGTFQNTNASARPASFGEVAAWMTRRALQTKQNTPPAVHPVSLDTLRRAPDGLRLTWIGHASLLLQWPNCTVLTDPMFGLRASPLSWAGPERLPSLPLAIDDMPPVDVVLLSHDHYDHLDAASIRTLHTRADPLFLVPLGVDRRLRRWGIKRVVAVDWWQYVDLPGWRFHCTPAQHFSGRGLWDRNTTLWAGWYIMPRDDASAPRLFFAGDTAYADHFSACCERLGAPDVACLPIGANRPRHIMRPVHMNPDEALQAFHDLNARRFIPIHWGTFDLADEPVQAPAARLRTLTAHRSVADRVSVLEIGTIHDVPPTPPTTSSSSPDRSAS